MFVWPLFGPFRSKFHLSGSKVNQVYGPKLRSCVGSSSRSLSGCVRLPQTPAKLHFRFGDFPWKRGCELNVLIETRLLSSLSSPLSPLLSLAPLSPLCL